MSALAQKLLEIDENYYPSEVGLDVLLCPEDWAELVDLAKKEAAASPPAPAPAFPPTPRAAGTSRRRG